jgi:hypothetical protein
MAAVEGDEYRLSSWGGIIIELRLLLVSEFSSFSICVCPRLCNSIADALAVYGSCALSDDHVMWDDVPLFVEGLVANDSTVTNE